MPSICDNTNQEELLRFWVRELTQLPANEVDAIVATLNQSDAALNSAA